MSALDDLRVAASEQAVALGAGFVGAEHFFLAWLTTASGPALETMRTAGLTAEAFREMLATGGASNRRGGTPTEPGGLSSQAQRVVDLANEIAKTGGREDATLDDALLAMVREPRGAIARALTTWKLKPSQLRAIVDPGAKRPQEPRPPAPPKKPAEPRREREAEPRRAPEPRQPKRDAETDDIPEARPPVRPQLRPAPRPVVPPRRRAFSPSWLLFIAVPISLWLHFSGSTSAAVFIFACVGVVPLAGVMGAATESIAARSGPAVGGLLNATFGNAAELIIAIAALRAGYVDLVKASITGSILGNLLLVLGLSLIAGGTRRSTLTFNRTSAGMQATMLALAVAGLIFPALVHLVHPDIPATHSQLSQAVSIILIVTYFASLIFVFRTHKHLLGGLGTGQHPTASWKFPVAVVALLVATVGIGFESEILVGAIQTFTRTAGVSQVFLGLIVIPIIGNAAEHASAIVAARKGHTDLALQIALGSSTQVALLVAPILVFVGMFVANGMDLVFAPFQVVALAISVVVATFITLDGESHWFEGVQLLALYGMIGAAAWFI